MDFLVGGARSIQNLSVELRDNKKKNVHNPLELGDVLAILLIEYCKISSEYWVLGRVDTD